MLELECEEEGLNVDYDQVVGVSRVEVLCREPVKFAPCLPFYALSQEKVELAEENETRKDSSAQIYVDFTWDVSQLQGVGSTGDNRTGHL